MRHQGPPNAVAGSTRHRPPDPGEAGQEPDGDGEQEQSGVGGALDLEGHGERGADEPGQHHRNRRRGQAEGHRLDGEPEGHEPLRRAGGPQDGEVGRPLDRRQVHDQPDDAGGGGHEQREDEVDRVRRPASADGRGHRPRRSRGSPPRPAAPPGDGPGRPPRWRPARRRGRRPARRPAAGTRSGCRTCSSRGCAVPTTWKACPATVRWSPGWKPSRVSATAWPDAVARRPAAVAGQPRPSAGRAMMLMSRTGVPASVPRRNRTDDARVTPGVARSAVREAPWAPAGCS